MTKRHSWQKLLALLAAIMMIAAACGGGADETTTTAAGGGGDETTTTAGGGGDETTTTEGGDEEPAPAAGGTLLVGVPNGNDINGWDPFAFSAVNFTYIRNVYESLIEYTEQGEAIPWLATDWEIADDYTSMSLNLRDDVTFHSGNAFDANAVAANLEKGAHPIHGSNVFSPMAIVENWEVTGDYSITINFTAPVPERRITDLVQFLPIVDPELIDLSVEAIGEAPPATQGGGTGAFVIEGRDVGQGYTLVRNENYWGDAPSLDRIEFIVFADNNAAASALEAGDIHMIYNVGGADGRRLADTGNFELVEGPGPLVQVLRINLNRGPFQNKQFRQAMAYLLDREAILEVGYAGIGVTTVLPYTPVSPAADPAYDAEYAYNPEKARELIEASGLSDAEMSDFEIHVSNGSGPAYDISQIFQQSLAEVGINVELGIYEGQEGTDRLLSGNFAILFGGIGNAQKFPTGIATNSIFRTEDNPVLGDATPQAYIDAIEKVGATTDPVELEEAYAELNRVIMDEAFGLATNTYAYGLIVHSPQVTGFTELNIDNVFVARTLSLQG